jgi:hypothetical protein
MWAVDPSQRLRFIQGTASIVFSNRGGCPSYQRAIMNRAKCEKRKKACAMCVGAMSGRLRLKVNEAWHFWRSSAEPPWSNSGHMPQTVPLQPWSKVDGRC